MDGAVLHDLEKLIAPEFCPGSQQVLTGEVLFGMATAVALRQEPGYQEKFARYIRFAAHAGSVAAQGIVGRLLEAYNNTSTEDNQVRIGWLGNAVSLGSLVAARIWKR